MIEIPKAESLMELFSMKGKVVVVTGYVELLACLLLMPLTESSCLEGPI